MIFRPHPFYRTSPNVKNRAKFTSIPIVFWVQSGRLKKMGVFKDSGKVINEKMGKLDMPGLPELPDLPLPSSEELETRIETFIEKAVAKPVAKVVSKVVTTPLMIVDKITSGIQEATRKR